MRTRALFLLAVLTFPSAAFALKGRVVDQQGRPVANATVSIATFNGEFESEFPVTLTEARKGKRFSFTLGSGSAQVTLESFQGTIRLVRPGTLRNREDPRHE